MVSIMFQINSAALSLMLKVSLVTLLPDLVGNGFKCHSRTSHWCITLSEMSHSGGQVKQDFLESIKNSMEFFQHSTHKQTPIRLTSFLATACGTLQNIKWLLHLSA